MANELDMLDAKFGELIRRVERTFECESYGEVRPVVAEIVELRFAVGNASRNYHSLKDALARMLDSFGGYVTPEVDAAISAMQAIGVDRWSMQAQIDARDAALSPPPPREGVSSYSQGAASDEAGPVPSSSERAEHGNALNQALLDTAMQEGRAAFHEGGRACPFRCPARCMMHGGWDSKSSETNQRWYPGASPNCQKASPSGKAGSVQFQRGPSSK